jgi:DNA-binding IclR family transcriptional regulator
VSEQYVQYTEQIVTQQEGISPVAASPAPMVERAFRLLELLGAAEESYTLSELARVLGMSKGSLHGLLRTLEAAGAVEPSDERGYVLGPRIYDLAQAYIHHAGLRQFALPAMRRLAAELGETIFLGRPEADGVRIVERVEVEGERLALRISAPRGVRVPLLAAATGRVVLASWPPERRRAYVDTHPLPRFTDETLTDPAAFLAAVEETARRGIGADHGEYLTGVNALAAPIHGFGGALVAILWIAGFASRFSGETLARAADLLRVEARGVSRALGAG